AREDYRRSHPANFKAGLEWELAFIFESGSRPGFLRAAATGGNDSGRTRKMYHAYWYEKKYRLIPRQLALGEGPVRRGHREHNQVPCSHGRSKLVEENPISKAEGRRGCM